MWDPSPEHGVFPVSYSKAITSDVMIRLGMDGCIIIHWKNSLIPYAQSSP